MAIISCPHCQGKLRFPDDLPPRKVKCPACANSFLAGPLGPIEEEAEAPAPKKPEPAKPAPKKPPPAKPVPKIPPPPKPAPKKPVEEDFEVVDDKPARARRRDEDDDDDKPRSRRRVEEDDDNRDRKRRGRDDDDDDKPRSKRREDDDDDRPRSRRRDEEDDRTRSKRRGRDDEEDDENDRPRSKRRGRDDEDDDRPRSRRRDEDDDDDDRPRSKRRGRDDDDDRPQRKENVAPWRNARQGFNLIGIGFWCQVGALGIMVFFMFLLVIVGEYVEELTIPAGIAGIANWILAVIGFSFFIAGAKKGNLFGLSIALLVVAALHLAMVIYISFQKETSIFGLRSGGSIHWHVIPTQLYDLATMIISSQFVTVTFIAALLEVARFVLYCLVLKEYARVCRDREISSAGMMQLIMVPAVLGISLLLFLILKMIYKNSTGGGSEGKYIFFLLFLIVFGGYIFSYVMSALSTGKAKDAILSRPR